MQEESRHQGERPGQVKEDEKFFQRKAKEKRFSLGELIKVLRADL